MRCRGNGKIRVAHTVAGHTRRSRRRFSRRRICHETSEIVSARFTMKCAWGASGIYSLFFGRLYYALVLDTHNSTCCATAGAYHLFPHCRRDTGNQCLRSPLLIIRYEPESPLNIATRERIRHYDSRAFMAFARRYFEFYTEPRKKCKIQFKSPTCYDLLWFRKNILYLTSTPASIVITRDISRKCIRVDDYASLVITVVLIHCGNCDFNVMYLISHALMFFVNSC